MRHRIAGRKLNRTNSHRAAMRRNLVASLFEHETVSTTLEKAKEVKPFAERLITLAKKGTLAARRQAIALLGNRDIIEEEDGILVKKGTIVGKLFSEIAPRYLERPGGYTRIVRLALHRLGDGGSLVLLQLVGEDEKPKKKSKRSKPVKTETVPEQTEEPATEDKQVVAAMEPQETEGLSQKDELEEDMVESEEQNKADDKK